MRSFIRPLFVGLMLGGLMLGGVSLPVQAAQNPRFLVPGNDGYGIADCLAEGAGCGQAVADAYCEAQGFKAGAESFGLVEDITASVPAPRRISRRSAFEISCRI